MYGKTKSIRNLLMPRIQFNNTICMFCYHIKQPFNFHKVPKPYSQHYKGYTFIIICIREKTLGRDRVPYPLPPTPK